MIERAKQEYIRLLGLSPNDHERHYCQRYMAFLRDFIAESEGRTSEEVQTAYEAYYQYQPKLLEELRGHRDSVE